MSTPSLVALPKRDLETLVNALRSNRLGQYCDASDLEAYFARALAGEIARDLRFLAAHGFSGRQMAVAVELIGQARGAEGYGEGSLELVTTGPQASEGSDTRVVVQRLFHEAKRSILVAGYEFYKSEPVFRALGRRMEEEPGLAVRFFVNLSPVRGRGTADAIREFLEEFEERHWPEGCRLPQFYYDPRTVLQGGGVQYRLHAKCVVVDGERAFISSANFTEAAHERNIEVGVMLRSGASAGRLVRFFDKLIAVGDLVTISG